MRISHTLLASCFAFCLVGLAHAEEGKGEKAGKKVDEAADKTSAETKKAGHTAEKKAKKAKHKTGEAVEEAGDKMKE